MWLYDLKRWKQRAVWLLYSLIELDLSPRQARRWYRKRFGIESSYRCAGLDDLAQSRLPLAHVPAAGGVGRCVC
jgi:hypothetical protein